MQKPTISNYLIFVLAIMVFISCGNERTSTLTAIENNYLKKKIQESKAKLNDMVHQTGYSPAGKRFIEICEQFTNSTDALVKRVADNEIISTADIEELIRVANYQFDTIKIDTAFINNAFEDYSANRSNDFATSLLLFNLSTVESTRELFDSYFYDVEYFKPRVISDKFTIKKGEIFEGTAISQAKMAAIRYRYDVNDPQAGAGFVELPSSTTSGDNDGIERIEGKTGGIHKIKIRTTQIATGKSRTFEDEFEITVIE